KARPSFVVTLPVMAVLCATSAGGVVRRTPTRPSRASNQEEEWSMRAPTCLATQAYARTPRSRDYSGPRLSAPIPLSRLLLEHRAKAIEGPAEDCPRGPV